MAAIAYKVAVSAGNVGRYRLLTVKAGQIIGFAFIIKLFPANTTSTFISAFFGHCAPSLVVRHNILVLILHPATPVCPQLTSEESDPSIDKIYFKD